MLCGANADADLSPTTIVPFCITNVLLKDTPDGTKKTFSSDEKGDRAHILLDVVDRKDRFEAEMLRPEDAAAALESILAEAGREEVLFYVHGWRTSCREAVETAARMNRINEEGEEGGKKRFLVLPVVWAGSWDDLMYGDDRRIRAPRAGDDFSVLGKLLSGSLRDSPVKKSIISHSMGNYVLRIFAQNHVSGTPIFEDIYMVAPDVRWDLFNEDYISKGEIESRDNTVTTTIGMSSGTTETIRTHADGIPAGRANGGAKIAALAKNNVHVLYTEKDKALLGRQTWHRFNGVETSALGRCAGHAMENVHPSLKDKVVFHNCGYMQPLLGLKHLYQDCKKSMAYYENPQPNGIQKKALFFSPGK